MKKRAKTILSAEDAPPLESESIALETERDIASARSRVRSIAEQLGFRSIDQTRLTTATSELARNIIKYAGRGRIIAQPITNERGQRGLRLIFEDWGPGIPDIPAAMRDGFTTGGGLGKGLPGSKRLAEEFSIESTLESGTRVTVARWI